MKGVRLTDGSTSRAAPCKKGAVDMEGEVLYDRQVKVFRGLAARAKCLIYGRPNIKYDPPLRT